jgi:hypothetical protein
MPSNANDWQKLSRRCVARVCKHEDAALYFNAPVDPSLDGLPDYLEVIKQPMDLATIIDKIERRQYRVPQLVLDDVALVWANCRQYNHVSHPVNDACDKCEKYFKEMWSKNGLAKFGTPSVLGPVYDPDIEDPNGPPEESEEEEDDEEEDDEYMVDAEGGWAQGTAGGATGAVGAAVQGGEAEGGAEGDAARKKSRSGKRKRKRAPRVPVAGLVAEMTTLVRRAVAAAAAAAAAVPSHAYREECASTSSGAPTSPRRLTR